MVRLSILNSIDLERTPSFVIINIVPHGSALKLFLSWQIRDNQREQTILEPAVDERVRNVAR